MCTRARSINVFRFNFRRAECEREQRGADGVGARVGVQLGGVVLQVQVEVVLRQVSVTENLEGPQRPTDSTPKKNVFAPLNLNVSSNLQQKSWVFAQRVKTHIQLIAQ